MNKIINKFNERYEVRNILFKLLNELNIDELNIDELTNNNDNNFINNIKNINYYFYFNLFLIIINLFNSINIINEIIYIFNDNIKVYFKDNEITIHNFLFKIF